jgi:hypothetical protein
MHLHFRRPQGQITCEIGAHKNFDGFFSRRAETLVGSSFGTDLRDTVHHECDRIWRQVAVIADAKSREVNTPRLVRRTCEKQEDILFLMWTSGKVSADDQRR